MSESKTEYTIEDVKRQYQAAEWSVEQYHEWLRLKFAIAIFEDEIRMHIIQTGKQTGCCDPQQGIYCDITRFLDMRIQQLKQAVQGIQGGDTSH